MITAQRPSPGPANPHPSNPRPAPPQPSKPPTPVKPTKAAAWPYAVMACCGFALAFLAALVLILRGPQG